MKYRLLIATMVVSFMAVAAHTTAQQPTANTETLQTRCTNAQNYLNNTLRSRDLRTRVDRLQAYQYIYQRLNSFVLRLERNNQPKATELRAQLNTLNKQIDTFKSDYETYDQSRDQAAKLKNCAEQYVAFTQKLAEARDKRAAVNSDVEKIQTVLGVDVKNQFDQLYQQLLATGSSGGIHE